MGTIATIIIALLVFGFLIFIHEFGHYLAARIFNVTINEFSIGMGPRIFSHTSKKTNIRYSIALFPIGGFVAMEGENADFSEGQKHNVDLNGFDKKPGWQRFIITFAGAFVNITAGFIAMIVFTSFINVGNTEVAQFVDKEETGFEVSSSETGLMQGDIIIAVDGKKVKILDELSYEIMRRGYEPIDITVIRGGEEILLKDVVFPTSEGEEQIFGSMDFRVRRVEKNLSVVLTYSIRKSALIIRMCWESIFDLIRGRYTFAAVSGPVGISSAIGDAAREGPTTLLYMVALISINLGVMNLLPIPALDGGRLFTILAEMVTRRKLPAKVEGMINGIGLILLLAFSFFILIKDVIKLLL